MLVLISKPFLWSSQCHQCSLLSDFSWQQIENGCGDLTFNQPVSLNCSLNDVVVAPSTATIMPGPTTANIQLTTTPVTSGTAGTTISVIPTTGGSAGTTTSIAPTSGSAGTSSFLVPTVTVSSSLPTPSPTIPSSIPTVSPSLSFASLALLLTRLPSAAQNMEMVEMMSRLANIPSSSFTWSVTATTKRIPTVSYLISAPNTAGAAANQIQATVIGNPNYFTDRNAALPQVISTRVGSGASSMLLMNFALFLFFLILIL